MCRPPWRPLSSPTPSSWPMLCSGTRRRPRWGKPRRHRRARRRRVRRRRSPFWAGHLRRTQHPAPDFWRHFAIKAPNSLCFPGWFGEGGQWLKCFWQRLGPVSRTGRKAKAVSKHGSKDVLKSPGKDKRTTGIINTFSYNGKYNKNLCVQTGGRELSRGRRTGNWERLDSRRRVCSTVCGDPKKDLSVARARRGRPRRPPGRTAARPASRRPPASLWWSLFLRGSAAPGPVNLYFWGSKRIRYLRAGAQHIVLEVDAEVVLPLGTGTVIEGTAAGSGRGGGEQPPALGRAFSPAALGLALGDEDAPLGVALEEALSPGPWLFSHLKVALADEFRHTAMHLTAGRHKITTAQFLPSRDTGAIRSEPSRLLFSGSGQTSTGPGRACSGRRWGRHSGTGADRCSSCWNGNPLMDRLMW